MNLLRFLRICRENYRGRDEIVVTMEDFDVLMECAEAVVQFSDLEPGYKGGAITEAAKKLMEEV